MAERKKTTSSAGKKSAKSASRTASPSSGAARRTATPQKTTRPVRREVGAVICLILAFLALLGYFSVHAVCIDGFCALWKGLTGYGFWLSAPVLFLCSYILAFHHGRPVRLRVWCALLLPVAAGALAHLFLAQAVDLSAAHAVSGLWLSGCALQSGGVVCGVLATVFAKLFSRIGAYVIFVVLFLFLLLGALNFTLADLAEAVRNRPEPAPYEEEEQPRVPTAPAEELPARRRGKPQIDIPVDDETPFVPHAQTPAAPKEPKEKTGFFNRKPNTKTPEQVLDELEPESPQPAAPVAQTPPQPEKKVPAPEPLSLEEDLPPIEHEPAVAKKAAAAETAAAAAAVAAQIAQSAEDAPEKYVIPPLSLLNPGSTGVSTDAREELARNEQRLNETVHSFGIDANIVAVTRGPAVTRYELELDQGVRLNKLTNLSDDIALALGATGVRIAPIPNKISRVGIEVPNHSVSAVPIRDLLASQEFQSHKSRVAFAVGKDIGSNCIVGDISKLPHLLIAGTTGSGKSVFINSLLLSLLYRSNPEEVNLIMVDPKMVELGVYNGIPQLLIPVVTDPKKAAGALQWAVTEMMRRYRSFSEARVRDLPAYNEHAKKAGEKPMPQIVVVIDELADLMMVAAKEVEESICRVAQMGRAAGVHLVIATQRPSADVITGLMKANVPSRIAFAVASAMESRIILDTQGAEKLVGHGDMLYFPLGTGKPLRVQGCLTTDEEVARVVGFIKEHSSANYSDEVLAEVERNAADKSSKGAGTDEPAAPDEDYDELLPAAIEVVVENKMASVSMLQRRLKLGYSRAARLVDQMEEKGVVGPFEGSKPRQVLLTKEQWQEMQYKNGMVDVAPDAADFDGAVSDGEEPEDETD